jgi:predicted phage terminase large subunit-like protein
MPDKSIEIGRMIFFTTNDTASMEKTTADFTVCSQWGLDLDGFNLFLMGIHRERMEVPKIAPMILRMTRAVRGDFAMIEEKQSGIGVIQTLRGPDGRGLTIKSYGAGNPHAARDKVARSTIAQNRFESSQVYFPVGNPGWLQPCVAELLGFPESAHDDFVDTVSQAAWYAHNQDQQLTGGQKPEPAGGGAQQSGGGMPSAWGIGGPIGGSSISRMPAAHGVGGYQQW